MTKLPADLSAHIRNIAIWKKDRNPKGGRLPKVLADETIRLCGLYGVKEVCKLSGLSNPWRWEKRLKDLKVVPPKKLIPISLSSDLGRLAQDVLGGSPSLSSGAKAPTSRVELRISDKVLVTFFDCPPGAILASLKEAGLC